MILGCSYLILNLAFNYTLQTQTYRIVGINIPLIFANFTLDNALVIKNACAVGVLSIFFLVINRLVCRDVNDGLP